MSIALILPGRDTAVVEAALQKALPDTELQVWPDIDNPESAVFAVAWRPPAGVWSPMTNLRAVMSYGAGVDFLVDDESLPESVQIGRFVDPGMARQISAYVLGAVLYDIRDFDRYAHDQQRRVWKPAQEPVAARIGVLGLGAVGGEIAARFLDLGFPVTGWRARRRDIAGVEVVTGEQGLLHVARCSDFLIATLPLTPETRGTIDRSVFEVMNRKSTLINVGRGETVVESDLLAALEEGRPSSALLDVFSREPLPEDHPFWGHPRIRITPHVAGLTDPEAAADSIVVAYTAILSGGTLPNRVDRDRGY